MLDVSTFVPENAASYVAELNGTPAENAADVQAAIKTVNHDVAKAQKLEDAITAVNDADAESIEEAVTNLAELVNDTNILDASTFVPENAQVYVDELNETAVADAENAGQVQDVINRVNESEQQN